MHKNCEIHCVILDPSAYRAENSVWILSRGFMEMKSAGLTPASLQPLAVLFQSPCMILAFPLTFTAIYGQIYSSWQTVWFNGNPVR